MTLMDIDAQTTDDEEQLQKDCHDKRNRNQDCANKKNWIPLLLQALHLLFHQTRRHHCSLESYRVVIGILYIHHYGRLPWKLFLNLFSLNS